MLIFRDKLEAPDPVEAREPGDSRDQPAETGSPEIPEPGEEVDQNSTPQGAHVSIPQEKEGTPDNTPQGTRKEEGAQESVTQGPVQDSTPQEPGQDNMLQGPGAAESELLSEDLSGGEEVADVDVSSEELRRGERGQQGPAEGGDSEEVAGDRGIEEDVEEEEETSVHTDVDICRSELEPSSEASIGGIANVDVCAEEVGGLQTNQDPVSLGSEDKYSSIEASGSQLEEKQLETNLIVDSSEQSQMLLETQPTGDGDNAGSEVTPEDHGSEVRPEKQTCVESQHDEHQQASDASVTLTKQAEAEAEAADSGEASDGEPSREEGDGDRLARGAGGLGEASYVESSQEDGGGDRLAPGKQGGVGSGHDEPGHVEGTREEGKGAGAGAGAGADSDSDVEETDTDEPGAPQDVGGSTSAEGREGSIPMTQAEDSHEGELRGDGKMEAEDVRKPADDDDDGDDDDNDGTETGKDAPTSTLQDVSEIESTIQERSDDESDVTAAVDPQGDRAIISDQREESSDTLTRSEVKGHGDSDAVSGVSDDEQAEQSHTQESPLEKRQRNPEGSDSDSDSDSSKSEEENPEVSHPNQQDVTHPDQQDVTHPDQQDVTHPEQQDVSEEAREEECEQEACDEEPGGDGDEEEQEPQQEQSVQRGGSEEGMGSGAGHSDSDNRDPSGAVGESTLSLSGLSPHQTQSRMDPASAEGCLDQTAEDMKASDAEQDQSPHAQSGDSQDDAQGDNKGDPKEIKDES
ncbi:protein starmaker-like [Sardina pilchardus]|uniref:protein starmaker-like n=1 Tax=Sardina pilchardus TaxID=27697 RepID=UPI002E0E4D3F